MTPRVANRLLKRIRDLAQVEEGSKTATVSTEIAKRGLKMLGVDDRGLEELDRAVLTTLIDRFRGGPVGLKTIAASIGEEERTLSDVVEPYLIQTGMLERSPKGRIATEKAYRHIGVPYPFPNQPHL